MLEGSLPTSDAELAANLRLIGSEDRAGSKLIDLLSELRTCNLSGSEGDQEQIDHRQVRQTRYVPVYDIHNQNWKNWHTVIPANSLRRVRTISP